MQVTGRQRSPRWLHQNHRRKRLRIRVQCFRCTRRTTSAHNELQQYEQGLADCRASIAIKPKYFYVHTTIWGTALLGLKDIPTAIATFSKAIELKPTFVFPYIGRGKAFLASGNKELAKLDFEHVLSIDPTNGEAREGLAAVENLKSPTPPPTQIAENDPKKIKQAREFLNDIRDFIAAQTTAADNITAIANEAANFRLLSLDLTKIRARVR